MSTDPNMEPGFLEKLGDKLSAFSDTFGRWLMRLFGSSNERYVRDLGYIRPNKPGVPAVIKPGSLLDQVNKLEDQMRGLTDEQLRQSAAKWKQRLADGTTLD